jgi:signal transduction histidine kinase/CheY-like chemotaxis protein
MAPHRTAPAPDVRAAALDPQLDSLWRTCLDGSAAELQAHAEALRENPVWVPWLAVLRAQRHHFGGEDELRDAQLAQAEIGFQGLDDAAGLATCRSLDAARLGRAGRWHEAIALLDQNNALPRTLRNPFERYLSIGRRRQAYWYLESYDEALRDSLRLVEAARDLQAPAQEATALTLLGGLEADLFNLEDAQRHCEQALALAQTLPSTNGYDSGVARRNLAYTLDALGRHDEALALIEGLASEIEAPALTENDSLLYATVLLHAGQPDRAQAWLDRSIAARADARGDANAWTATQAELWLTSGDAERARALCESYFQESDNSPTPSRSPADTMRIHRACARACTILGDPGAALARHDAAFACYEALVGRAARARRVTFEMEHSLERERWQRELAEQRQQQAESERERLDKLNLALEAAMHAKTRFLAAASHDLRQPVQALMMYTAALKHEPENAARQSLMARLDGAVGALATMFDALLDVSRLDAGVVAADLRVFSLAPLLERLADECRSLAGAQPLDVRLYRPRQCASTTYRTRSDPMLLERCLRNLLDNARKYTHRGGIVLGLRQHRSASSVTWRVEVRDTGIGIAPEDQARVFDEFFQVGAESSRPDEARGLGLGLSIVNRLATMLGHPVGLLSQPGRGTRVWLDLPCLADAAAPADTEARGAALVSSPYGESARVVAVVEDDTEVRTALVALLTQWRHRVFAGTDAASVRSAWRDAGGPPLDAIVSDLRLAGPHDGIDTIAQLREFAGAGLPALVLTGETDPARLHDLNQCGLPWLVKPVQPARLRSWLQSLARDDVAQR